MASTQSDPRLVGDMVASDSVPLPRDSAAEKPRSGAAPPRLLSLDAYRGFIMLVLAAEGLGAVQMARKFPDSIWTPIARQFRHTPWIGGVFWDMIMPAFILMVGVAMPLSFARRRAAGDDRRTQFRHAAMRAGVLVLLGMVLMSQQAKFLNVLTQMGLGYVFVFLLLDRSFRTQLLALTGILVGYWLLFALYPVPGPGYDFKAAATTAAEMQPGFWAHWSKNVNIAADFDRWLLNLFPQDKPFVAYVGSVQTLNFIPAMANMILGVMSGQVLMSARSTRKKLIWLLVAGAICMAIALVVGATICPIVKRIWTPSFALYSGAWTLWMLAAFYWVVDLRGWKAWTYPLVVFGTNSIVIYLMTLLWPQWIGKMLRVQLGANAFSGTYGPVWEHAAILAVMWIVCWWLYRRKIFIRI